MTEVSAMGADERMPEIRRRLLEQVLDAMGREGRGWVREWDFGSLPVNGATGVAYRGRNALMLWSQMIDRGIADPRFVTFRQAKAAGCSVTRGAKALYIERWRRFLVLRSDPKARLRQPKTEEEWARALADPAYSTSVRPVGHWAVFSAEQVEDPDGRLLPAPAPTHARGDASIADRLVAASPCPVRELPQTRAYYSVTGDYIMVPHRDQFMSIGGFCRTLIHEQCHSTGALGRLARPGFDPFSDVGRDDESYALEELVAELGCVYTANAIGLDLADGAADPAGEEPDPFENSVAYLRGWASRTADAPSALLRQATQASAACDWLVENAYRPSMGDGLLGLSREPERETEHGTGLGHDEAPATESERGDADWRERDL